MSIYEKIIPRHIHYVLFWMLAGVMLFALQEVIFRIAGETSFLLERALLVSISILIILVFIDVYNSFRSALSELKDVIRLPFDSYAAWAEQKTAEIFSFKTPFSKIVLLVGVIVGNITVVLPILPFQSYTLNVIWIILWQLVLFVCFHCAYVGITILNFLIQATKLSFDVHFYRPKHPSIMALWSVYLRTAISGLMLYVLLLVIFWQSPLGFMPNTIMWLVIASLFPLFMLILSFYHIHIIFHKIKQSHIAAINQQVQTAFKKLKSDSLKENTEILSNIMEIQRQVEKYPDWPLDINSVLTFLVTLVLPLIQIISWVRGLLGP